MLERWNEMIIHPIYLLFLYTLDFILLLVIYLILFYDNKYQKFFCIKWLALCMKYKIKWMFTHKIFSVFIDNQNICRFI